MTPFDPRGLTWDRYSALMCETFSPDQLETMPEENWRDWVDNLNGLGYFAQNGIPGHSGFWHWQDWAEAMVGIMNVERQ